jgi:hypothetical protein
LFRHNAFNDWDTANLHRYDIMRSQATALMAISLCFILVISQSHAFSRIATRHDTGSAFTRTRQRTPVLRARLEPEPSSRNAKAQPEPWTLYSKEDNNDETSIIESDSKEPVIVRGFEQGEISDEAWENVETGEPPKWIVMKEVRVSVWNHIASLLLFRFIFLNITVVLYLDAGHQYLYVHTGRIDCLLSNGQLCLWSGVAGSSDWNEGNWNLYRCFSVAA